MKEILMSIQPKWCELIAAGKKTVEVRKTAPKETPFKVYMYCTRQKVNGEILLTYDKKIKGRNRGFRNYGDIPIAGKVVGEYVCDKVDRFLCTSVPYQKHNNLEYGHFLDNGVYKVDGLEEAMVCERNDLYIDSMLNNNDLKEMCLSAQELFNYVGIYKHFNTLHITAVKFYDKPKELGEFVTVKCTNKRGSCSDCKTKPDCIKQITRPPQGWQYVEDIGQ